MHSHQPQRLRWLDIPLADLELPLARMVLTKSLTSGLTLRAGDPLNVFWGVGDRGPNIKPRDAVAHYGLTKLAPLVEVDGAKVMPVPGAGPSLARFCLASHSVELEAVFPLQAPDGTPVTGLPPRTSATMESEPVFGLDGTPLGNSSMGADTEGISALPDGRFCIAEEYGPSLLLVRDDGVVSQRIVPHGTAELFAASSIPLVEALPALATARKLNRGFEALALAPDQQTLFVAFQSPLAHPNREAHEESDVVRIWALDVVSWACKAEYAYPLDRPDQFLRDVASGPLVRSDIKVSELAALPDGSLLVLERATSSTHIYRVEIAPALELPRCFRDPAHRPTLEQLANTGLRAENVPVLAKELVISTDEAKMVCGDLEGMVVLEDGSLLLSNDSDYGTGGAVTEFWLIPQAV